RGRRPYRLQLNAGQANFSNPSSGNTGTFQWDPATNSYYWQWANHSTSNPGAEVSHGEVDMTDMQNGGTPQDPNNNTVTVFGIIPAAED
ncbi:MAG TPA: hypothetical protein VND64_37420, partial [Pirellulales bacterium]|nr:hypothetical protein [Pirellulales bacterium]